MKDLKGKISCVMPAFERHHSRRAQYFDLSPKHDKHKRVTPDEPAPVIEHFVPALAVTDAEPATVIGYVAPAHTVTYTAPFPTTEYVAFAPTVSYTTRAPVIEHMTLATPLVTANAYVEPALVIEYIAPPPAVFYPSFSQQLPPACTHEAVTGLVNAANFYHGCCVFTRASYRSGNS